MLDKKIFISSVFTLLLLSLLFQNLIIFKIFNLYKISIFEILFLILFFLLFIFKNKIVISAILNYKNFNYFDYICVIVFSFKALKYLLDLGNPLNLYDLMIWFYLYLLMKCVYLCLSDNIITVNKIKNIFIFISIFSIIILIFSFIIYHLNFQSSLLWYKTPETFHPYFGNSSTYFVGLLKNYNLQAYLILPGYFFCMELFKKNNLKYLIILLFLFCFAILKSKVLLLVLAFSFYEFFLAKKSYYYTNIKIFIFYFLIIFLIYTIVTHLLILDSNVKNIYDKKIFLNYFTREPVFTIFNYEIYGSLFYKLKLMAINNAYLNNYIFFNEINFNQLNSLFSEYSFGVDAHSDYFNYLSNYGFFGLLIFLIYFYYFFNNFTFNLYKNRYLFYIYCIFLIESIISDVTHFHFLWILFGVLYFQKKSSFNLK